MILCLPLKYLIHVSSLSTNEQIQKNFARAFGARISNTHTQRQRDILNKLFNMFSFMEGRFDQSALALGNLIKNILPKIQRPCPW